MAGADCVWLWGCALPAARNCKWFVVCCTHCNAWPADACPVVVRGGSLQGHMCQLPNRPTWLPSGGAMRPLAAALVPPCHSCHSSGPRV